MATYNQTLFEPPAPFAYVAVSISGNSGLARDIPLLVDTGADITLLPRFAMDQLQWIDSVIGFVELEGFSGGATKTPVAEVEVKVLGEVFEGRYALIDNDYGILGRDILNEMTLVFNGPDLTWNKLESGNETT